MGQDYFISKVEEILKLQRSISSDEYVMTLKVSHRIPGTELRSTIGVRGLMSSLELLKQTVCAEITSAMKKISEI